MEIANAEDKAKPPIIDFLGFTPCCGKTRNGEFVVLRLTNAKRLRTELQTLKHELKRRMHLPIAAQ